MTPEQHRSIRELLGSYALGHLDPAEQVALQSHLDGCPTCRLELAELAPLAEDLLRVNLSALESPVTPPAELGARMLSAMAGEAVLRNRRARRQRIRVGVAVAASVGVLFAAGALTQRELAPLVALPQTSAAPVIPKESVALRSRVPGVDVSTAIVIPHTWGIELQMTATGLDDGATYRGVVTALDGTTMPAGEFLGIGAKPVKCNLQAALLRPQTATFSVLDASGATVMTAALPQVR